MRHLAVLESIISCYGDASEESEIQAMCESRHTEEHRKTMIHRIHRIQGQVAALERGIAEGQSCEKVGVQARAIERATASLAVFLICSHLESEVGGFDQDDPLASIRNIQRLLSLTRR